MPLSDPREIEAFTASLDGWLTTSEGRLLHQLARECAPGTAIVEIGSYKGKSTTWLGRGSRAGSGNKVYAIDPHEGSIPDKRYGPTWTLDTFRDTIHRAGLDDLVTPIVATSHKAFETFHEPIGLLFIDGEHEYTFVRRDYEQWCQRLTDGAVLCMHDTVASSLNPFDRPFLPGWEGPNRVFRELVLTSASYSGFGNAGTISYARRRPVDAPMRGREAEAYRRATWARHQVTQLVTRLRHVDVIAENVRRVKRVVRRRREGQAPLSPPRHAGPKP